MRPVLVLVCSLLLCLTQGFARLEQSVCGAYRDSWREEMHLPRGVAAKNRLAVARDRSGSPRDIGNIAILEDSGGVVARRNPFDLDQKTLQFSPAATSPGSYSFQLADTGYDPTAASSGLPLALGDDDSAAVDLPFAFPFFGNSYLQVFVNS